MKNYWHIGLIAWLTPHLLFGAATVLYSVLKLIVLLYNG